MVYWDGWWREDVNYTSPATLVEHRSGEGVECVMVEGGRETPYFGDAKDVA